MNTQPCSRFRRFLAAAVLVCVGVVLAVPAQAESVSVDASRVVQSRAAGRVLPNPDPALRADGPSMTITGVVRGHDNDPEAGVAVGAYRSMLHILGYRLQPWALQDNVTGQWYTNEVKTDANGRFTIRVFAKTPVVNVPGAEAIPGTNGSFALFLYAPPSTAGPGYCRFSQPTTVSPLGSCLVPVPFTAGATVDVGSMRAGIIGPRRGAVHGRVVNANGTPAKAVPVRLRGWSPDEGNFGCLFPITGQVGDYCADHLSLTAADGTYTFDWATSGDVAYAYIPDATKGACPCNTGGFTATATVTLVGTPQQDVTDMPELRLPSDYATVPDAPPAPTVSAGDRQITVTAAAPTSDGGAPIVGYALVTEPARPGHPTPDITYTTSATTTIGDVPNDRPVTVYAVARNRVGLGAPSPRSVPVTPVCDTHAEACSYVFGGPGDIAVPADFNGDGHADFAVFRPNTGTWFIDTNRDGTTDMTIQFGSPGDRAYAADYNGDGHADLIIFRGSTGTWYIDTNLDGTADTVVRYASPGDLPYIGDFNHDGHIDLGIFRPSEGNWYVDTNGDGYGDIVEHYASPGDIPAPADYDRNNTVDYAIFRPGNGCFYINDGHYHAGQSTMRDGLSLPNGYATTVIGFAGPGDVMAPADYNGTGTTQLAIFRPSTGTWWIRNTAWNTPRGNETTACR